MVKRLESLSVGISSTRPAWMDGLSMAMLLVLFAGVPCSLPEKRRPTKAQGEEGDGRASSILVYNIEGY